MYKRTILPCAPAWRHKHSLIFCGMGELALKDAHGTMHGNFRRAGLNQHTGELRFQVGLNEVSIPTRTAWVTPGEGDSLRIGGVSFQEVDHETGILVDELLESVLARHRIQP